MIENGGSRDGCNPKDVGLSSDHRIDGELVIGRSVQRERVALKPLEADARELLARGLSGMSPWRDYQLAKQDLNSFLGAQEPGAERYAIFVGEAVVGAVIIWPNWLRGPYLQFLGLLEDHQGQGIGGLVLGWLESIALKKKGSRHVWILVSDFNLRARAFYQRHGYEEISPIPDVVRDGMVEVLLRKRLR